LVEAPATGSFSKLGSSSSCTSPLSTSTGALTIVGIWSFKLQITDSSGLPVTVTSTPVGVTVNAAMSAPSISANPSTTTSGLSSVLSTTASFGGGTSPYTCQWLKKGPLDSSYSDLGPSFSCNVGDTPNSYQWYSDGACTNAIASASLSTYTASPTVNTTYTYKVTDLASSSQCSPSDTATVNPALVAGAITPPAPTIDTGQSITLTANPSGGTTPYSYNWYSAAGCPSGSLIPGAILSTYLAS